MPMQSISDDDICSNCKHCNYSPGEMSSCALDFPGDRNADGYIVICRAFDQGASPQET